VNRPVAGPLGRSAYAGRGWEGFSPDPYLTGVAMEETINGVQKAGVQATAKHFIANEQETQRNPSFGADFNIIQEAISSNLDDRTMHELYLWPFANAVRANVASVMCSYNRINGSYGCENSKVLNGFLKTELGFQGYVMSDWGGTHSGIPGIKAGQDMDMPGGLGPYGIIATGNSHFGGNITAAVSNGTLAESRVDDMIVRIMTPYYALGQDHGFPTVDPSSADLNTFSPRSTWLTEFNLTGPSSRDVRGNHAALIREQGAAAIVLLKNENKALPLKAPMSIAVFGNDAGEDTMGSYSTRNFEYGTLGAGGGSGTGRFTYLVSPLEAIKVRAARDKALVQSWLNNTLIATTDVTTLWVPKTPDVCLVFLKTWAEEGDDRTSLNSDWHGNEVVSSVAAKCNNTVVITHSSGPNILPFADHPNVTAILAAHYPGQESGNSVVDVLYGAVNPSGHLPYTIALNASDYNAPPTTAVTTTGIDDWQSWFSERLEIDYRYFDAHNISVRYPFGFGLSYTTFALSNLQTTKAAGKQQAISAVAAGKQQAISAVPATAAGQPAQPGGNPALWDTLYTVTATVRNTGRVDGAAVPQLYVTLPPSAPAGTPPRQLRGFDKIALKAGQAGTVSFPLMRRDLSYWDVGRQEWVIPAGEIGVAVGFSSRDLKLIAKITAVAA
jgi:beta-glucosidase